MAEFLSMGGYAFYVWSAYGLTALVLLANALAPWWRRRQWRRARRSGTPASE